MSESMACKGCESNLGMYFETTKACGQGIGLAVCPRLGVLATSEEDTNTVSVWWLPSGADTRPTSGLAHVRTLGGTGSPAPMQFEFDYGSGSLAFTPLLHGSDMRRVALLLLVTDAGHDAVHMIDVASGVHAGYVAAPGSIAGPRGVAACGVAPLVAVSVWKMDSGDHVVHLYRAGSGGESHWIHVRAIGSGTGLADGQFRRPFGLRFSGDGVSICVADAANDRVSLFRVSDGGFVRHIATGVSYTPYDVEEVEGGWAVVCCGSLTVEFVRDGDDADEKRPILGEAGSGWGSGDVELNLPIALAFWPGLGLVVREFFNGPLQVFATPNMVAMAAMSASRVGWMTATYRAAVKRIRNAAADAQDPCR